MRARMQRIVRTLILISLVYALPLVGAVEAIVTWQLLLLIVSMTVMLVSQPDLSANEAKRNSSSDRYSVILILAAGALGQLVSVIEWSYYIRPAAGGGTAVWTAIGLLLIMLGLPLRIWSIRFLGRRGRDTE